jgi:hypothetical protein
MHACCVFAHTSVTVSLHMGQSLMQPIILSNSAPACVTSRSLLPPVTASGHHGPNTDWMEAVDEPRPLEGRAVRTPPPPPHTQVATTPSHSHLTTAVLTHAFVMFGQGFVDLMTSTRIALSSERIVHPVTLAQISPSPQWKVHRHSRLRDDEHVPLSSASRTRFTCTLQSHQSHHLHHLHHCNDRYNITHDLFEATNLALEFPEVVTRLEAQLMAWVDSMPTTPPDKIVLNAGCDRMSSFGHVTPIEENGWGATEFDLA